jgi:tetratricopeptide (TPR) repeat protein
MIDSNAQKADYSYVDKGRKHLDRGDLESALKNYEKAFDPEALDEQEAREMLIEARAFMSRKHVIDALESFEDALVMGTDVQRKQALQGIVEVAEVRARLKTLTEALKKGLKKVMGAKKPAKVGLTLLESEENIVLISESARESLPKPLSNGGRIRRLTERILDNEMPLETSICIPYTTEADVDYIIRVATALVEHSEVEGAKG